MNPPGMGRQRHNLFRPTLGVWWWWWVFTSSSKHHLKKWEIYLVSITQHLQSCHSCVCFQQVNSMFLSVYSTMRWHMLPWQYVVSILRFPLKTADTRQPSGHMHDMSTCLYGLYIRCLSHHLIWKDAVFLGRKMKSVQLCSFPKILACSNNTAQCNSDTSRATLPSRFGPVQDRLIPPLPTVKERTICRSGPSIS